MISFFPHKKQKRSSALNFKRQFEELANLKSKNFAISQPHIIPQSNYDIIKVAIIINQGIHEGEVFQPSIYLKQGYPFTKPVIYNNEAFPHPNINQITKQIILVIIEQWKPIHLLSHIIYHLASTLHCPNLKSVPNNNLNIDISLDYSNRNTNNKYLKTLEAYRNRRYWNFNTQDRVETQNEQMQCEYMSDEMLQYGYNSNEQRSDRTINLNFKVKEKSKFYSEIQNFSVQSLIFSFDVMKISEHRRRKSRSPSKQKIVIDQNNY